MRKTKPSTRWDKEGGYLHIETDHAVINVYVGLQDYEGRRVETISIAPSQYAGEPKFMVVDGEEELNHLNVRVRETLTS